MRHALAWCLIATTVLAGCATEPPVEPQSLSDSVERGPLKFTTEARPKQVQLGDPITIELRVHTPEDYDVQFPGAEALGDLTVVNEQSSDAHPGQDGGLDWRHTFTIESYSSGPLEVPPMAVEYVRKTNDPDAPRQYQDELVTGTLKLEVRSALTTQDSVDSPRDITGIVSPPPRELTALEWTLIAAAIVAGLVGVYGVYRLIRRIRSRPKPPILPEVWAFRALAELEKSDWFGSGRVREYYYRLSEIVRGYIEMKFDLAAPEMTTEEFLVTMAGDAARLPYDAGRLATFLEACDIVKYAAYTPLREDADDALHAARSFIDATAAARQTEPIAETGGRAA